MDIIEIKNLTKIYKAKEFWKNDIIPGVENINLTIAKGEVFGLLGLNGAGKTTLMKVLLGLLKPTSGSVKVFGGDINERKNRKKIGYLSELPYFPKYLTANEILDYFCDLFDIPVKEKAERIKSVLKLVRLEGKENIKLKNFSKGMQERLGLAQAILNDPELLFLDEPMSGLDPLGYKETRDIIIALNKQGKTIFFNSHILSEVEKVCDRVGIIKDGRLVAVRKINEIKKTYATLEQYFVSVVAPSAR